MAVGYDGKLHILAFDHRGSFQEKLFGIVDDPSAEQSETASDAPRLIGGSYRRFVEVYESAEAPVTSPDRRQLPALRRGLRER